jgi:DNA-binding GntR family transcriptional regulator
MPHRPAAAPSTKASLPVAVRAAGAVAQGGTTQQIVDAVTSAIIERRLMPGTRLAEQSIAEIFGVSRTIVRQALNQLSRDRLVRLEPARGASVATPSAEEARQVFETRAMLEGELARRLSQRITDAQVATLRQHLEEERKAIGRTDVPGRTRLLADFHVVLAQLLGNEVLGELLGDLLSRSSLISLMYQSSMSAEQSQAEHVLIVDALERRDAAAAARLMVEHIASVERNLRPLSSPTDLAAVLRPGSQDTRSQP